MFQEQYALAYKFAPDHLGVLCDTNPLKGLERQTSNVTVPRSLSLLYVVPTKLFRDSIDVYVLRRLLGVFFFGVTLVGLLGLAGSLGFSLLPAMFLVVTVGLSTHILSRIPVSLSSR